MVWAPAGKAVRNAFRLKPGRRWRNWTWSDSRDWTPLLHAPMTTGRPSLASRCLLYGWLFFEAARLFVGVGKLNGHRAPPKKGTHRPKNWKATPAPVNSAKERGAIHTGELPKTKITFCTIKSAGHVADLSFSLKSYSLCLFFGNGL